MNFSEYFPNNNLLNDVVNNDWSTAYTLELEIASRLPVSKYMNTTQADTRPVHVYFNRNLQETLSNQNDPELPTIFEDFKTFPMNVIMCDSWSQLSEIMPKKPRYFTFCETELQHTPVNEIIKMVDTLAKLVGIEEKLSISVGIHKTTPIELIKELQMYLLRLGKNQEMIALQLAQWPYIQVPDLKTKSKPPKSSDEEKDKENKKRGN